MVSFLHFLCPLLPSFLASQLPSFPASPLYALCHLPPATRHFSKMGFALPGAFSCLPGYSWLTAKAIPIGDETAQPILRKRQLSVALSPCRNPNSSFCLLSSVICHLSFPLLPSFLASQLPSLSAPCSMPPATSHSPLKYVFLSSAL